MSAERQSLATDPPSLEDVCQCPRAYADDVFAATGRRDG